MLDVLSVDQLLYAAVVVGMAYLVRGIAGFGSGLIAIPLLAQILPVPVVVPVVGLLDYAASLSHGSRYRRQVAWRDLLPLLPAAVVGVATALLLFRTLDAHLLRKAMGGFILLYGVYTLLDIQPHRRASRWWAIPAGGLGGLVGALFGTGGPFYVIYLGLRQLDKSRFRATVAMIFIFDGASRIIGYLTAGMYSGSTLALVAAGLPLLVTGMWVGGHIHTSISTRTFSRGIAVLLLASGLALLLR
ncbi:MAG: sulfite exporter TauE/SafE family protein [Gammaproteobacteria bacterium]